MGTPRSNQLKIKLFLRMTPYISSPRSTKPSEKTSDDNDDGDDDRKATDYQYKPLICPMLSPPRHIWYIINFELFLFLKIVNYYMNTYVCMCVCVCVSVSLFTRFSEHLVLKEFKKCNVQDCQIMVSSNSSRTITFIFRLITLRKVSNPLSSQLLVKYHLAVLLQEQRKLICY